MLLATEPNPKRRIANFINMQPLITSTTLAAHLESISETKQSPKELIIIDCRHNLSDSSAGFQAFQRGHIPGAIHLHLDLDLAGTRNGRNGRHPLPDPAIFAGRLALAGISNTSHVVAYDADGGVYAARLWWLLRWLGHDAVQVLDGGWQAWLAEGNPSTPDTKPIRPQTFKIGHSGNSHVQTADVEANLQTQEYLVIDARAPDRFSGACETLDPVAGHIPGAINRFYRDNLDAKLFFKSADILRLEWEAILKNRNASRTIHQCGSGAAACHNLLALEIAGLHGAQLYPGSWSEWCSDGAHPVAHGAV